MIIERVQYHTSQGMIGLMTEDDFCRLLAHEGRDVDAEIALLHSGGAVNLSGINNARLVVEHRD